MLIISKHKDYYDSAVGMGIDKSIVYERKYEKIPMKNDRYYKVQNTDYPILCNDLYNLFHPYIQSHRMDRGIDFLLIGFCGKIIPVWRFRGMDESSDYNNDNIVYDYNFKSVNDRFKSINLPKDIAYYEPEYSREREARFCTAWDEIVKTDTTDLHRYFNTPVFIIECKQNLHFNGRGYIHINPLLKDYKFAKQYDPYTSFQEIQMYLSGVLASGDEVKPTEMTEKQKVNQHGFDEKYGFRTRPKNKRKKRK